MPPVTPTGAASATTGLGHSSPGMASRCVSGKGVHVLTFAALTLPPVATSGRPVKVPNVDAGLAGVCNSANRQSRSIGREDKFVDALIAALYRH